MGIRIFQGSEAGQAMREHLELRTISIPYLELVWRIFFRSMLHYFFGEQRRLRFAPWKRPF
jgi:hypothetical protein